MGSPSANDGEVMPNSATSVVVVVGGIVVVVVDGIVVVGSGCVVNVDVVSAASSAGEQATTRNATRRVRRIGDNLSRSHRFGTSSTRSVNVSGALSAHLLHRTGVGPIASGAMIRETPGGDAIDPVELQMGYPRGRLDRPWVMANFVTTIDGAAVVDGGSTAINDEDDRTMFGSIRAVPDFILVGAETVRAENYRPVELDERRHQARLEAGLEEVPHLIVVTRSLSLDPEMRVFGNPNRRVTILTGEEAPAERAEALAEVADVVRLGGTSPADFLHYLRLAKVVLCEGGPSVIGQFIAAGLVDEMAITVAPLLVAGASVRMASGPAADPPLEMSLDRVLYGDRSLFLRYLRG
jgi:riboflavin biosynthesis pyrimidine reductase